MKRRFKEKCEVCGQWSHYYQSHNGLLVCDNCMIKHQGKIELEEPEQLSIYDQEELKDE